MNTLNIDLTCPLKNFYRIAYDDDDICDSYINEDATFGGLLENITEPYDYIFKNGEEDSVIRERLFEKLADIMGVEYNDIDGEVIVKRWRIDDEDGEVTEDIQE